MVRIKKNRRPIKYVKKLKKSFFWRILSFNLVTINKAHKGQKIAYNNGEKKIKVHKIWKFL